jgi:hypothetical protein
MYPLSQYTYNFPLSGHVNQKIEPDLFFGSINPEVGDSEIEKEVFYKTASYGKQIGMITEIVLALAEEIDPKSEGVQRKIEKLKKIQEKVKKIKAEKKTRTQENAKEILDKLKHTDPDALNALLKEYQK